jgi:hexosaminidase
LHAYFNQRIEKILSKRGKTVVGWEEVLQPDVPKDVVIQSWMGPISLAKAAKQGYRGILSSGYYLDHIRPAWKHYEVDPMTGPTAELSPEQAKLILGGEACMWQEYVSAETLDSRIWPRVMAVAERLWSPPDVKDVDSMYARLAEVSADLDWLGLTHNSGYSLMLRRIAGSDDVTALRTLADVVEPVKEYTRNNAPPEPPTSLVPLNRLVDAARPESLMARHFHELVEEFLRGPSKPGAEAEIRAFLIRWSSNQIDLQPLVESSFLMKEVAPVAQDLSTLGATGLEALAYLDRGIRPPADWTVRKQALLEEAKKPKAQVLLMIVPAIQELVDTAGKLP